MLQVSFLVIYSLCEKINEIKEGWYSNLVFSRIFKRMTHTPKFCSPGIRLRLAKCIRQRLLSRLAATFGAGDKSLIGADKSSNPTRNQTFVN